MAEPNQENIPVSVNSSSATPPPPAETPNAGPDEAGITPPAPGAVISGAGAPPTQPAPISSVPQSQPATTPPSATPGQPVQGTPTPPGGKRWLKRLLVLLLAIILVAGGWLLYDKVLKSKPATQTTQSNDIPLLKIGMNGADYGNFYPDMSTNEYAYIVNAQVFEGLVRYENKSKIVPVLASNWTNPDANTWVFNLQKGIKFHDGHTMTAKDVKYSLDAVIASNSDLSQTYASTIASVDAVNDGTVKITTKQPDPALLNKLAWLYVIDANLPKGDDPTQAGTGPYQLKSGTKPSSTNVQLVAAQNYHGTPPRTKALDFGSKDDAAGLIKAFQAGQFNIIGPVPPNSAKKVSGAKEFISSEPNVAFLGMNTVSPGPLQNKQVREAIRYAVSPSSIAQADGTGATPISQVIPASIPGYNPTIKPYKQNVAKAKQLLAQAGYPNGLTLKLSSASDPKEVAEVAAELKAIGITATVDQHADFDEFINFFTGGQAQIFLVDYSSDTLDGLDVYQSTIIDHYYNNPQLTTILDQANTETNPAKRLKLLQQAATIIDQDVPVVPLFEGNDVWLMDQNYALHQDLPSAYISVYFSNVHKQ